MRLTFKSVCLLSLAALATSRAASAQIDIGGGYEEVPVQCLSVVTVYVQPYTGFDPPSTADWPARVAMGAPFKTIQTGIDACLLEVSQQYANGNQAAQGLVVCMPGVYGPEQLPIRMRDRISVQGQGARRTIIRGGGADTTTVLWPDEAFCDVNLLPYVFSEVLVDFSESVDFWVPGQLPWSGTGDSEEFIDGFTFQGGDVQVHNEGRHELLGRVSNCVFDMRHQAEDLDGLDGPWIGLMTVQQWDATIDSDPETPGLEGDYRTAKMNILNNTFILGHLTEPEIGGPIVSRQNAVGILDVNDPLCWLTPQAHDPVMFYRGLGSNSIQNNLLRSIDGQSGVGELLGVDGTDTAAVRLAAPPQPSNAFNPNRIGTGGTNGFFFSAPDPANGTPVPAVDTSTNDPSFVGEVVDGLATNFKDYRDWRLMPDSPMIDQGVSPELIGTDLALTAVNGTSHLESGCKLLQVFDEDMEVHGNPRAADEVDIGADEFQLVIMAGNWANDSSSHQRPPQPVNDSSGMNPVSINESVVTNGKSRRFLISSFAQQGRTADVYRTSRAQVRYPVPLTPSGPDTFEGWILPPGVLNAPVIHLASPRKHRVQYIDYTELAPWSGTFVAPPLGFSNTFSLLIVDDPEGSPAPPTTYFNVQAVIHRTNDDLHGNLQVEYR